MTIRMRVNTPANSVFNVSHVQSCCGAAAGSGTAAGNGNGAGIFCKIENNN